MTRWEGGEEPRSSRLADSAALVLIALVSGITLVWLAALIWPR
jgi:hypothetical protein